MITTSQIDMSIAVECVLNFLFVRVFGIAGNAAQERYRVHKRKPVFSHEGLVLSLVDLLSKQASDGRHASGELYRW